MVAVISADAYDFLAFSELTSHLEDNGIGGKNDKDTKLGSNNQEPSPSAGKNTGVNLAPCLCMEVHPYSYFRWCRYF